VKHSIICIAFGVVICLLPTAGCRNLFAGEAKTSQGVDSESKSTKQDGTGPVACVQTISLKKRGISENTVVYGSVIAAPGALKTISIPFESQVLRIMVNEGQKVSKSDALLKIQPSPDTLLKLNQAQNAYDLAQQSYKQMENRRSLKLATNEQVLQAKQTLDQARLNLESMKKRGIDGISEITSSVGGLIKKIHFQEGSIVAAGNPIMDIIAQNRVEVLLGVEPEDIERVHTGQTVGLTRVNAPASPEGTGKVRRISYAVNPSTRLVDIFVTLTSPVGLLLGEAIEGKIVMSAADGLVVPRSAVLPEGDRYVLFTVKDGRAVKHLVQIGIENSREYQITGDELKAGEDVVVSGNYELLEGMAVTTEACK